ncbi:MAG: SDR family NAD(P)-dependent oxidoreductase [Aliishimia sp.]
MPLTSKVALVTGASAPNGIGRAIALRLAANGASVVVSDLPNAFEGAGMSLLNELVDDIRAGGGQAVAQALDVTSGEQIAAAVSATIDTFGSIDILVNNAGSLTGSSAFLSTTPDQWRASFDVNIMGPMMLCHAVIPVMQAKAQGRIINIGSTGSLGAEPGFGAYTAMKHGLVGFTKTLAAEFGSDGILCNTVCPGYIATDMHMAANTRLAAEQGISIDEIMQQRYASVALRDAGLPRDVANAVAYLAGPEANYVTGINLPVTGGVPFGI